MSKKLSRRKRKLLNAKRVREKVVLFVQSVDPNDDQRAWIDAGCPEVWPEEP